MPKTTSFNLGDHFCAFIEAQVRTGRFGSASEVIRDGLRLLEEREAALEAVRNALIEGEQSGPATPLDMAEVKRKAQARAARAA